MSSKESKPYFYKLHSSFVSMRKQILNLQKGYNKYKFTDILPTSYLPIILTHPNKEKNDSIGKSYIQKETPFLFRENKVKFSEKDIEKNEELTSNGGVSRLTLGNVKNGNFIIFQNPEINFFNLYIILFFFFIILHFLILLFENIGYVPLLNITVDPLVQFVADPLWILVGLVIDVIGVFSVLFKNARFITFYLCFTVGWLTLNMFMVSKYVAFFRIAIETILIFLSFFIREKFLYTWFTTNTLE